MAEDDLDMVEHLEPKFGRRKTDTLPEAFAQLTELSVQLTAHKLQLVGHVQQLSEHANRLEWLKDEARSTQLRVANLEHVWDMVREDLIGIKTQGSLTFQIIKSLQETVDQYLVPALPPSQEAAKRRNNTLDQVLSRERDWRTLKRIGRAVSEIARRLGPVLLIAAMLATWAMVVWHWIALKLKGAM